MSQHLAPTTGDSRLVTIISASTEVWGAERSLLLTARHWPGPVPPVLIGPRGEFTDLWKAQHGESSTVILPASAAATSRGFVAAIAANPIALNHIRASEIAVVNSLSLASLSLWLRRWSRTTLPVLDLHDYLPTRWGRLKLNLVACLFARIMTISDFAASQVPIATRLGKLSIITRPVSISAAIPSPAERETNHLLVSVIGRLDRDKRIELAIAALALGSDGVVLRLTGAASEPDDGYEQELRSLANTVAPGRVLFDGKLSWEDCFSNVDAVIVTNPLEPLGRTVLEAQAFGIPVVVPDQGGSSELVDDGKTGLMYRSGDSEALAAEIQLLHSYELRCALSLGGVEIAAARQSASEYARTYYEALHGRD